VSCYIGSVRCQGLSGVCWRSVKGPSGVRQGSVRGPSGVRQGSVRGPSGVRQGSLGVHQGPSIGGPSRVRRGSFGVHRGPSADSQWTPTDPNRPLDRLLKHSGRTSDGLQRLQLDSRRTPDGPLTDPEVPPIYCR
jgi:hypothetical protein